jgi:hypothetical protein
LQADSAASGAPPRVSFSARIGALLPGAQLVFLLSNSKTVVGAAHRHGRR